MEYVAPANGDPMDPARPYIDGDPSIGQAGSIPSARFFNLLMAEGRNLVEGAGLTLDPNDDAQWLKAIQAIGPTPTKLYVESFTVAGTTLWTVPDDVHYVVAEVWGGGGGGSAGAGGSGGGGGYAMKVVDVTPGEIINVTVGGGGGDATYPASAGDGGVSSFGTYCSATGGVGGAAGPGLGGDGVGGDINRSGGRGADLGSRTYAHGGNAAGGGGQGGVASNSATDGSYPGGGGAAKDNLSGRGARGQIVVRYWK